MTNEDKHKKMIRELLADDNDRLNAWECEFLDSLNRQSYLSARQIEILEKIWAKVFE